MVYKTLVVQSVAGGKPFLVILASDKQLDLKRMASSVGEKKVQLVSHAEAEKLTGLQVGGISALMLMQKQWDIYLDKSATELQNIVISAGQRGLQLRLPVTPLLTLLRAILVDVSMDA
jgi:Cys-tRNA(Pro)/Cys-tRNA(Cys) deacylase